MKTDDLRESQQVEDRRGQSSGSFGGGGLGAVFCFNYSFHEEVGKPSWLFFSFS